MRAVRILLQIVLSLATVVVVLVGVVALNAYRALPETDGKITLPPGTKLSAPVTVVRDAQGVPTITAQSEDDAYFTLGYVHAQDRLFQMELTRRSGQGRLSELIGSLGLSTDRFVRTMGLYRRAEADFAGLDPAVQQIFRRYADGVNTWLTSRDRPLPLEFHLLWTEPEPWTPADSLVWQKLMAIQLSGNWNDELLRAAAEVKLGPERAEALWPQPRIGDPITVTPPQPVPMPVKETRLAPRQNFADLAPDRLLDAMLEAVTPTLASNAWAVAGRHTASGKPLLANDPHLGLGLPSLWYLAILKTPERTLAGATVPGVPLHVLGHNGAVAWGITTTHGDTQDLFIERALPDGTSYEAPDGPRPFETRAETINVRFGTPVTLTVRETRHGPVISDILTAGRVPATLTEGNRVLALAATMLAPEDRSAEALYRMARAPDAAAFREATRLFHAPQQNVMYADANQIGFVAAGRLPLRKAGNGTVPVPGWSGEYDWTDWAPFETLPQIVDPPSGMIVNGNNRIVADGVGPMVAASWPEAYRARRILEVLDPPQRPLTPTDMAALQLDVVSIAAREVLPTLLPWVKGRTPEESALLESMATWDGTMAGDRPEPLVYAVWLDHLKEALIADDLGELYPRYWGQQADLIRAILAEASDTPGVRWCDRVSSPEPETCAQQIQASWNAAIDWIRARETGAPPQWRWDHHHVGRFEHALLEQVPGLRRLGSRLIPTPGGETTVNRGSHLDTKASTPLAHVHGPGLRAVYDLGDLSTSRFALAGGQSGHVTSPLYASFLVPWRDGATLSLAPTPAEAAESQRLILAPP